MKEKTVATKKEARRLLPARMVAQHFGQEAKSEQAREYSEALAPS